MLRATVLSQKVFVINLFNILFFPMDFVLHPLPGGRGGAAAATRVAFRYLCYHDDDSLPLLP